MPAELDALKAGQPAAVAEMLETLPAVDTDRRLLGIVTVDDLVSVIQAEAAEDMRQIVAGHAGNTGLQCRSARVPDAGITPAESLRVAWSPDEVVSDRIRTTRTSLRLRRRPARAD